MIFFIITTAILCVVLLFMIRKYNKLKKQNRTLLFKASFDNIVPRRQYNSMATFLRQKKSKLSFATKIDLLNMWVSLIIMFPKEYSKFCSIEPDKLVTGNDTLTQAQHKKAIIEALEELAESQDVITDDLTKIAHHLYFIIFD